MGAIANGVNIQRIATVDFLSQGPELKGVYSTSLTGERSIEIAKKHQAENEAAGTDDPLFMYVAFQVRVVSLV